MRILCRDPRLPSTNTWMLSIHDDLVRLLVSPGRFESTLERDIPVVWYDNDGRCMVLPIEPQDTIDPKDPLRTQRSGEKSVSRSVDKATSTNAFVLGLPWRFKYGKSSAFNQATPGWIERMREFDARHSCHFLDV